MRQTRLSIRVLWRRFPNTDIRYFSKAKLAPSRGRRQSIASRVEPPDEPTGAADEVDGWVDQASRMVKLLTTKLLTTDMAFLLPRTRGPTGDTGRRKRCRRQPPPRRSSVPEFGLHSPATLMANSGVRSDGKRIE